MLQRSSFLIALLAATAAAVALAQSASGPLPGGFSEIIDVRVVNLEVVVTDRAGVAVRGLGAEDFVLLVDGEKVPIDYFSEVVGGRAVLPASGESVPGLRAVEPGGAVGTSYLVFIDDFFSLPTDRNRVLRALEGSLALGPEDRMAIVSFDGRELEMLSTWSQSEEELRRALRRHLGEPAYGLQRLIERRQFDFDRALAAGGAVLFEELDSPAALRTYLEPNERYHVVRLAEQVERSVAAASATLRSFAMPPGRKVMLLLSGGWPLLPADFLLDDPGRFVLDRDILSGEPLFRPLVDTANLLGYTIYPVDVPGLGSDLPGADIAQAPPVGGFGTSSLGGTGFLREGEVHATLNYLARQTGGQALINAQRMRAFESVVADTRSYYWLGFTPERGWDDRRHGVEIRTRNPELRLRSRQGFLDSSRQREVSMAVESALLFGNPPGEETLRLEFGEPRRSGRGKVEVPLEVLVPLDQLTFLPGAKGLAADAEIRFAVVDSRGARSEMTVLPLRFELSEQPEEGQFARYETTLRMRRMRHRAVVALHDVASGRILSAGADVDPDF